MCNRAGASVRALSFAAVVVCALAITTASGMAEAPPLHIVEQYKAYIADIGNIGSRYATTQTFYLAVVTALIAIFSLKDTNRPIQDYAGPVFILVFLLIGLICYSWWQTLQYYRDLFGAKFAILGQMEKAHEGLFAIYGLECRGLLDRRPGDYWWDSLLGRRPSICGRGLVQTDSVVVFIIGLAALAFAAMGICVQVSRWLQRHCKRTAPARVPPLEGRGTDGA